LDSLHKTALGIQYYRLTFTDTDKVVSVFHTALRDCADALISHPMWPTPKPENGRYTLFIHPKFLPVKVYCDMDGGGWTVSIETFLSTEV